MYDIFIFLILIMILPFVMILYVNSIREDLGKPKLINLNELLYNILN